MQDTSSIKVQGFKSFVSLWQDAYDQISQECLKDSINNDIKLFETLRNMVLSSEKLTFIRSHKLSDFNTASPKVRTTLNSPYIGSASISWNRIPQQSVPQPCYMYKKQNVIKYNPSQISYLNIGNAKIISHNNSILIKNDCVFENRDMYEYNDKIYIVMDDNFIAKLDKTRVLYPVSSRIMNILANNEKSKIDLKHFQEMTDTMYQKLTAKRNNMK